MKKLFLTLLTGLALVACSSQPKAQQAEESAQKVLVLYYSVTNTTQQLAEYIQQKTGADIEKIQPADAYSEVYQEIIARSQQEMENNTLPELQPLKANIADYDIIFLGYPIWFGTYAQPIKTLLSTVDFSGKVVVPFSTSGSSGIGQSVNDLKQAVPGIQIPESVGVRSSLMDKMPAAVDRVLISLGLIEGENEVLADFSEQKPVTEAEAEIFNAAISTYPMLNGNKAVTVGSRTTSTGTDYKFVGESTGPDGSKSQMDVYVTKENGDAAPYFTKIDR